MDSKFKITPQELRALTAKKHLDELDKHGGVDGVASLLDTSLTDGLDVQEAKDGFAARIAAFGRNVFDEPPSKSIFKYLYEAAKDPILVILQIFAVVSIVAAIAFPPKGHEKTAWIEGVAIIVAVVIVISVTVANNFSKEKKFKELNRVKNDRLVKVVRGGSEDRINIADLQVGDLVILDTGDAVPADGLFVSGHGMAVDESIMTGEAESVKKNSSKPFMLSGCQVSDGYGKMLVTSIGMNSEWGVMFSKLSENPDEQTPLQENLSLLAKFIGWVGTAVGVALFIVLTIRFTVEHATADEKFNPKSLTDFIHFAIAAITVIVVAVPEGLPLAVTIALAYSMKAMLKDNNLVRNLAACETMGGATNICSDKTGTLTENRMTVTRCWIGGKTFVKDLQTEITASVNQAVVALFGQGVSINSSAFLKYPQASDEKIEFVGSKTECALIVLSDKLGQDYTKIRKTEKIIRLFPFSSARKRMSTLIAGSSGSLLHVKGASEIVLGLCTRFLDSEGNKQPLRAEDHDELKYVINSFATSGLRTLCVAYKEMKETEWELDDAPEDDLTLIAIVGIEDPLRPEVPHAIATCKKAGITVRMVTGDNVLTATKIATDCGILEEGYEVIEGPVFNQLTDEEIDRKLPRLRVLARSSPSDKHRLVKRLKAHKEVVAVTGDGTNDGPALNEADVGLAMGIAGTEIAKEASDIIIMDDNFASIVKAVLWGRCVRQNIQKFLQFQLNINVVALSITFLSACLGKGEPFKPIQLLWVNLIQDTLAALSLATDSPTDRLLESPPAGRAERLIKPVMVRNILCVSSYQMIWMLLMLFAGDKVFNLKEKEGVDWDHDPTRQYTILFNTFVFLQIFNEFNARHMDNTLNPFSGSHRNKLFIIIMFVCTGLQILFVTFGGVAMGTVRLNPLEWVYCIAIGVTILPVGVLVRKFVPIPDWKWLKYKRGQYNTNDSEVLDVKVDTPKYAFAEKEVTKA